MSEKPTIKYLTRLTHDEDKTPLIRKLTQWGIVPAEGNYMCPSCGEPLTLIQNKEQTDGLMWRCEQMTVNEDKKRVPCGRNVEFRKGTFFERSKLSLFQILGFVNCWVYNISLPFVCLQLTISIPNTVNWGSFCREVVLNAFVVHKQKLGGVGKIVEIDESKFGKRKEFRGQHVEGQWVFGGYERGTGRIFMVPVEDRGPETLLPIIQDWILPGTTIISDFWRAYDCLSIHGYEHLKVDLSLTFKELETGAHTNGIFSSWRAAKATMSSSGRIKVHIPGNLARYMFQKKCTELGLNRTEEFLRLVGLLHNPPSIDQQDEAIKLDEGD